MRTLIGICLGLTLALPALANSSPPPPPPPASTTPSNTATGVGIAGAAAGAKAGAKAKSNAVGVGAGGVIQGGQSVVTVNGSGNGNGSQSVASAVAPGSWTAYPCAANNSGAMQFQPFGVSLSGADFDDACRIFLWTGSKAAAKEYLCGKDKIRQAFQRADEPCAADSPRLPTESSATPTPVAATPVALTNGGTLGHPTIDKQCAAYTAAQRSRYPECR